MKLRMQSRRPTPTVPTASMADIAFLLIIFFMLTTTFSPERTQVRLPDSVIRTEVSERAAIVAITEDGLISFTSGEEPGRLLSGTEELAVLTREIIDILPDKEFVLKADREARYEYIDGVLDTLRTNGAKRIGLLTTPQGADAFE
ncbi:MAG TPA: biopolymer transporter ExbD [Acidobacteriota bacterium]|nr:biopolymer transporter ExbD [Acidobacteriota bacterium]